MGTELGTCFAKRTWRAASATLAAVLACASTLVATVPGDTVHVADVEVQPLGHCKVSAEVLVVDQNGNGVEGATVTGEWSGCRSRTDTAETDAAGVAVFSKFGCGGHGWAEATFTVVDVSHPVASYDAAADVETSDSVALICGKVKWFDWKIH